jgi:hypothetical protein
MADRPNMPELTQGHAAPSLQEGITRSELLALVVSAVWVVLICGLLIIFPSGDAQDGFDPIRFVMSILAVLMPVGLLWAVLLVGRALRLVRDDARRLGLMIDTMRQTVIADRSSRSADLGPVERKMTDIAQAARATEGGLATFSTKREPERQPIVRPLPPRLIEEQPALALGTAPDEGGPPLLRQDMIRALNFPDTDKDEEGFSALRRALKDRQARQLVQASQDVLTLLSQDGIYMDDLNPDRARPEVWRKGPDGCSAWWSEGSLLSGADHGTDARRHDLSRCRPPFPAPLRPDARRVRARGDGRRAFRPVRNPHSPRFHAVGACDWCV